MNSKTKNEPNLKRADFFYGLLRPIVYPVVNRWYGCKSEPLPEIDGNYLIISNHNTNVDMIMVAGSCKPLASVSVVLSLKRSRKAPK